MDNKCDKCNEPLGKDVIFDMLGGMFCFECYFQKSTEACLYCWEPLEAGSLCDSCGMRRETEDNEP